MSDILSRIVATKWDEVAQRKKRRSITDLEASIRDIETPRGFLQALNQRIGTGDAGVVAECRKPLRARASSAKITSRAKSR